MSAVVFKQGDTWSYIATVSFKDSNGNNTGAAGWTIKSELVSAGGKLLQVFNTGWIDQNTGMLYHRASSADTKKWLIGPCKFDIKFTNTNGDVISSDAVDVTVVRTSTA